MTSKEYICCVTSVDPFWLMEYGGLLYDIKRIKNDQEATTTGLFGEHYEHTLDKVEDDIDINIRRCKDMRDSVIQELKMTDNSNKEDKKQKTKKQNILNGKENSMKPFKRRKPFFFSLWEERANRQNIHICYYIVICMHKTKGYLLGTKEKSITRGVLTLRKNFYNSYPYCYNQIVHKFH